MEPVLGDLCRAAPGPRAQPRSPATRAQAVRAGSAGRDRVHHRRCFHDVGRWRAKDGHPAPFKLRTSRSATRTGLNNGKRRYDGRSPMFHDAIKAKYPQHQGDLVAAVAGSVRPHAPAPDLLDDHFYMNIPDRGAGSRTITTAMIATATKMFAGEWATNSPRGPGRAHGECALGERRG